MNIPRVWWSIMSPDATVEVDQPAALAHQFDSLAQQRDASTFGMWVFLATEVLFFGVLFATYAIYRAWYAEAFAAASHELLIWAGTINTVVLITSSLTMALGVHAAQTGDRRRLMRFLVATIILGATFLGIKAFEYYTGFIEGHLPGGGFRFEPKYFQHAQIFFSLYYLMTGLHALHMIVGLVVMAVMLWLSWRVTFTDEYYA